MTRIGMIMMMLTLVLLCLVGCSADAETTTETTEKEGLATSTETTVEQVEETYYFETVENFEEVPSGYSYSPLHFRHTVSQSDQVDEGKYYVEATATFPETITLNGVTYELDLQRKTQEGREVSVPVKNATPGYVSNDNVPCVFFDAVHGTLLGINNFQFHKSTQEDLTKTKVERAINAVKKYLPYVDIDSYEWESGDDSDENEIVVFRKYVHGFFLYTSANVVFRNNEITSVWARDYYEYEDLDVKSLRIDKAEHEKVIASLLDYIRNGHTIEKTTRKSERIIRTSDGRYAIEYETEISVYKDGMELRDISKARFYLE